MIEVVNIADELVELIKGFKTFDGKSIIPDGITKVVVERGFHFVDGKQIPDGELNVAVYPIARRKQSNGKNSKSITATVYVVIKAKTLPNQASRDKNDALLKYGVCLDKFLEGRRICGAINLISEDDQFYWFPDEMHKNNHFSSLLELQYKWEERKGGNPPTQSNS